MPSLATSLATSLSRSLSTSLSDLNTLPFWRGAFTNTTSRYLMYAGRVVGPFASGVLATRTIFGKNYAQFEKAITTAYGYSEAMDSLLSSLLRLEWTANSYADPLGNMTLDKLSETNTDEGGHAAYRGLFAVSEGDNIVCGIAIPDERTEFRLEENISGSYYSIDYNLSTVESSINAGTYVAHGIIPLEGGLFFWYAVQTAASAGNREIYLEMLKDGEYSYAGTVGYGLGFGWFNVAPSSYLSSYIQCLTSSAGTRNKDQFRWIEATVDAYAPWMRYGFKCGIIFNKGTSAMAASDGGTFTICEYDATVETIKLYYDGSDSKIKWSGSVTGALGETDAITISALDTKIDIGFILDSGLHSMVFATVGGVLSIYSGIKTAAADGDIYHGMDVSEANQLNVAIVSEPYVNNDTISSVLVYDGDSAPKSIEGIDADDTNVYTATYFSKNIIKIPRDGGDPVTLIHDDYSCTDLSVDATDVYYTNIVASGKIRKIAIAGGEASDVVTGLNYPYGIAVDATDIYFAYQAFGVSGKVAKYPKAGGSVTDLVTDILNVTGIAIDATYVYYSSYANPTGYIARVAKAGGEPEVLVSSLAGPTFVDVDDTYLYWYSDIAGDNESKVHAWPLAGGDVYTIKSGLGRGVGVAIYGNQLYYSEYSALWSLII